MDQAKQPDWNISDLYSRAWQVVKKNKVLWLFGVVVGSASSNFNFPDFGNSNETPKLPDAKNLPNEVSQVLGINTQSEFPFQSQLVDIFMSVPIYMYVLGIIEIILFFGLILSIAVIFKTWGEGMLIQGTSTALGDKKVTIADTAKLVLPHLKSLLWLYIVPILLFYLGIGVTSIAIIILATLVPMPINLIFILIGIVALGAAIYWGIMLAISLNWASREVILNNQTGKEALKRAFKITKRKFWPSLILGAVNNITAFLVILIPIILLFALVFGAVFGGLLLGLKSDNNPSFMASLIGLILLLVIPIVLALTLLGGIIESFKATVWTDAYLRIKGKYEN